PLGLVGPEDEKVIIGALGPGPVETSQAVLVKQQLQEGVHIETLGLKLLRHRQANDSATINVTKVKSAVRAAKHLRDFGSDEVLKVIADGFAHPPELFFGLFEESVCEVVPDRHAFIRGKQFGKVGLSLFEFGTARQELKCSLQ